MAATAMPARGPGNPIRPTERAASALYRLFAVLRELTDHRGRANRPFCLRLSVIERVGDPDFEPACFGPRIGAKGLAGRALARIGGEALAAAVRISGRFDSMVLFARPPRPGRPRDP